MLKPSPRAAAPRAVIRHIADRMTDASAAPPQRPAPGSDPRQIRWRNNGYFDCFTGQVWVKGVAADIEAISEILKRAGTLSTTRSVYRASAQADDLDYNPIAWEAAK